MAGPEFFNPSEGGESYDPAAFERFKEQMKKSGAQMAAARAGEQKQKKKEDKLAAILLRFIQSNQKSGILLLAARCLEENIPPSFVLAVILLGNDEIRIELKREVRAELIAGGEQGPGARTTSEFSLVTQFADASLPLKVKAEIDTWGKGIWEAGSSVPFRVLETALDSGGNVKKVLVDCCGNVLDDFLSSSGAPQVAYDTCFSFSEFMLHGIMKKLREQIENQKELSQ